MRKQDGICIICGQVINLNEEAVERDHIIPTSEGGKDTIKNIAVIHKLCHQSKTVRQKKGKGPAKKSKS